MIFTCGKTLFQRLEDRSERKRERKLDWHRYFTLLPRRIDNDRCVCLQYIERIGIPYMRTVMIHGSRYTSQMEHWRYEYRIPKPVYTEELD